MKGLNVYITENRFHLYVMCGESRFRHMEWSVKIFLRSNLKRQDQLDLKGKLQPNFFYYYK